MSLLLEPDATELDMMRQLLAARGIALEPPPGWKRWCAIEVGHGNATRADGPG